MKMKLPSKLSMPECHRVDKFCCCLCSLRHGTAFIGVVYTLFSLLAVSAVFSYIPSFDKQSNLTTYGHFGFEFGEYGIYTLINMMKITTVIWFLVNLSLLYGVLSDRVNFVTPWVGWHLVLFFLQIIAAVWIGSIIIDVMETDIMELVTLIIAVLLNSGFTLYFLVVVNSFRTQLTKNVKRKNDYNSLNSEQSII